MAILLFSQYPRSEALIRATRHFDRGRITKEELEKAYLKDRLDLKTIQEGLPYLSSGLFHASDLNRPLLDLYPESKAESLTRFFETNTFFRKLEVENASINEAVIDSWIEKHFAIKPFRQTDSLVYTLPFLFLLKDYSEGLTLEQISDALLKIVERINFSGKGMVCFYDPTFGYRALSLKEERAALDFVTQLKKLTTIPLALITSFFPLHRELKFIYSLPFDAYGIDFYHNTVDEALHTFPKDKILLAGLINIESTLQESETQMDHFFTSAKKYLPREQILVTTAGPAELLPREVMDKKLLNMKEILKCQHVH